MPRNEMRTLNLPIADALAQRTGVRPRVRMHDCEPYAVATFVPKLVFSPRTASEAAKTIALLAQEGASVIVRGAGTKQSRPPFPIDVEAALDATRCKGIVDYVPADLTVTVAAGTPYGQLQETLRAQRQFFPSDPPFASDATVGGVLSSRIVGSLRLGYGSVRDNVLGMRVCLSDGSVAFTGSRVVKSVAGYDIAKLFVGARGTLGFIAEVTLKVAPLPAEERAAVATFSSPREASDAAAQITAQALFPMAIVLLDSASTHRVRALSGGATNRVTLVVRCGGSRGGVREAVDGVRAICGHSGALSVEDLDQDAVSFAWTDVAELFGGSRYPADRFAVCKVACLPSAVPDVYAAATMHLGEPEVAAHPPSGIVFAGIETTRLEDARRSLQEFARACLANGWNIEYVSVPANLGGLSQPVPERTPLVLMRRLKAALDPTGTFDPGRFLAGI